MPAIVNMTINDGKATPVAHTFAPVNIDAAGVAKWADRSGGIALGFPVITESLRMPSNNGGSRNYKLAVKVVVPVLELTSPSTATGIQPAPTKAYDLTGNIEVILPERCALAERKDLHAFLKNVLSSDAVIAAIERFESTY